MKIKKIIAKKVKDSRDQPTIQVIVETKNGEFKTSAPSGKSKGMYEAKSYTKRLSGDIKFINKLEVEGVNQLNIEKFEDLNKIEKLVNKKIGGNTLFALEASLLKALAKENKKEFWEFLWTTSSLSKDNETAKMAKDIRFPRPVGNTIGGGVHSKGIKGNKPDFQEFLFIANGESFKENVELNETAYRLVKGFLECCKTRNDEGAWETCETNIGVLDIMNKVRGIIKEKYRKDIDIGLDIAASSFYKNGRYYYKNRKKIRDKKEQIEYLLELIGKYKIFYIEDCLDENDFLGFSELKRKVKNENCLIVGDDLTVTNPKRTEKAIKADSINAIILKPNQIGSLLKFKEVVEISKKAGLKTIISHRSGETMDDTIADLAVGFECDFIKTGIYGENRKAKLNRLVEIERKIKS